MTNNIEDYKKEIIANQHHLIATYCKQMVVYEESRQLYEKMIQEYENNNQLGESVVKGSQIIMYHDCGVTVKWALYKLDGTHVYTSQSFMRFEVWKFDLPDLVDLEPGTQLKLKALSGGKDSYAPVIIQYEPSSNGSLYFEFHGRLAWSYSALITSLYSPYPIGPELYNPVLRCSNISAHNSSTQITKYAIETLDGNRLYLSDNYTNKGTLNWKFDLSELILREGDQVRVKAVVVGGKDDTSEVILEYAPASTTTAYFDLVGNAFRSMFEFNGTAYYYGETN